MFIGPEQPGGWTQRGPQQAPPPQQGGSDWTSTLAQVLQLALPAVAGYVAGNKGQIGAYAHGFGEQQQVMHRQKMMEDQFAEQQMQHDRQAAYQDEQVMRQRAGDARAQSAMEAQAADQELRQQAMQMDAERREKERQLALMQKRFDEASKDYGTSELVKQFGPNSFSIEVPGIGPVNLQRLAEMGGVPPANFGTAAPAQPPLIETPAPSGDGAVWGPKVQGAPVYSKPPVATKEPLITIQGPDGPVRGKDGPGVRPYERPRAEGAASRPVRRSYTYKDEDPDSATFGQSFRITEDEDGNEINKVRITGGAIQPVASHAQPPAVGGVRIKSIKRLN